ncbi:hypothetical protein [Nocardioides sp. B-3]|uniref:hypothetical protein n=1 Tax=Nocardioides sp. B-3 TaxID=2895565 RepID=UPI0021529D55|nr:hypothetical protein [Nocardioides sp. B-3]UUZ58549.1 hypothetical protein LP418_20675 [Nocardioides sp. B-3]
MSAVSLGVLTATPQADEFLAASSGSSASALSSTVTRDDIVSRSESRVLAAKVAKREAKREVRATRKAIKRADLKMWTTAELNLWSGPEKDADKIGVLEGVEKVLLTGRKDKGRVEVVVNGRSRWVSPGYFAKKKPETGPLLGGTCSNGSTIDAGRATLYDIHDVVCANWPQITSYGTGATTASTARAGRSTS